MHRSILEVSDIQLIQELTVHWRVHCFGTRQDSLWKQHYRLVIDHNGSHVSFRFLQILVWVVGNLQFYSNFSLQLLPKQMLSVYCHGNTEFASPWNCVQKKYQFKNSAAFVLMELRLLTRMNCPRDEENPTNRQ